MPRLLFAFVSVLLLAACAPMAPPAPGVPPSPSPPRQLTVAVAANFQGAAQALAAAYQQQTGVELKLAFGSSGNFFAQIQNGAPFDVFLSADMEYPRRLVEAGQAAAGSLRAYATGKLALWAPASGPVDPGQGLQTLTQAAVHRVAIANPATAPYGAAAVAALKSAGLDEQLQSKLVTGDSVAQAAQFVRSGAAEAGLVALSQTVEAPLKDGGRTWVVPPANYPAIQQGAVVLRGSRAPAESERFLDFLRTPPAVDILTKYGYDAP